MAVSRDLMEAQRCVDFFDEDFNQGCLNPTTDMEEE